MIRPGKRLVAALAALTTVAASLVALSAPAQAAGPTIRITEVEYNGSEFVELTNVGDAPQDMTGWSFSDNARTPGAVSLSAFGSVAVGESVILAEASAAAFRTSWGLAPTVKVIGGNTANLGRSDEANIYDSGSALVDRITFNDQGTGDVAGPRTDTASAWVSAANLGANRFSTWTKSTPGDAEGSWATTDLSPNVIGSPGRSTLGDAALAALPAGTPNMRITEIEYNGSEFVEFTNVGDAAQDMTGWSYSDNARIPGAVSLSAFGTVAAGESVILSEAAASAFRTTWGLDAAIKVIGGNSANLGRSDEVNLYDGSSALVDRLTYNDQGTGDVAGPRTDTASAWVTLVNLGANKFSTWTKSTLGDAEGSWSTGGLAPDVIGSPGASALGTVTPAAAHTGTAGGGSGGGATLDCTPEMASGTGAAPAGAIVWPGGATPVVSDSLCAFKSTTGPEGRDVSGLVFDKTDPNVLWAVKNKNWVFKLTKVAGVWVDAPGWTGGKELRFPGGTGLPDSEGITIGPDGFLYITTERDNSANSIALNSVLRFDPSASSPLSATNQWNLTSEFPELNTGSSTQANLGFEGVTFVPDSYLVAYGFVDQSTGTTYKPSSYPLHGSGLYFAALENNGKLYAYVLNSDSSFRRISVVDSGMGHIQDVQYDADIQRIWALCDNTCGVTSELLKIGSTGSFVVDKLYGRPVGLPDNNMEGFAVAPSSTCASGVKEVVWSDDGIYGTGPGSPGEGHALYSGTVNCDLGLGSQGVVIVTTPAPPTTTSGPAPAATVRPTATPTPTATPSPAATTPASAPIAPLVRPVVFVPPAGDTNPSSRRSIATGVTLVSQATADKLASSAVAGAPARTLAKAPVVNAGSGKPFQPEVNGLPRQATVEVFIVINGARVPLAELKTDKSGGLTLPALSIKKAGAYNVGITQPNGTISWIKVRVR